MSAQEIQAEQIESKPTVEHVHAPVGDQLVEEIDRALEKGQPVQMKSSLDKLSVWQALKAYKRVSALCMFAAFSASLDGYQINLNGSIVANKGFVALMTEPGEKAIAGRYVSAWGGIQSTGQFIGQVALQFVTDALGRKIALFVTAGVCVISIIVEAVTNAWYVWLIAKLLAGMGVGMLQATLPMYISEQSPTQLRGFLINAYSFWFVVGQLMAPVALSVLNTTHPYDWRVAVYTQFAMVGIASIIYVFLPESPWKLEQAERILLKNNGHIAGYDVHSEIVSLTTSPSLHQAVMVATVEEEKRAKLAAGTRSSFSDMFSIMRGTDGWRFLIALWPKLMQQFVGLSVFNSYSTYFFQLAGNKTPFNVTVILACVQMLSVIITASTTDTWGRRPLTVYPYCITTVAVLCLGIVGCFDYSNQALGSLLIFFACVAIFTTTGASAIGYAYLAEIPTQTLRARTAGWGLAVTNLFGIMFSFVVPIMLAGPTNNPAAGWGPKTGFFFAGTGTIVCVIGWFIIPEVARRSPAELNELFAKRVPPRKFKGYVTDVQLNLEEQEHLQTA